MAVHISPLLCGPDGLSLDGVGREPACKSPVIVQRRAAFDIGSGTTKLLVLDVDVKTCRSLRQVHTREVPVLYGVDARSNNGCLSADVQDRGIEVLRQLLKDLEPLGIDSALGVATEVFRKASNGSDFIERIREELGLSVCLIDQGVEADLGFRTAGAISNIPQHELVMWDCGGGSFQMVAAPAFGEDEDLRMHLGAYGDAVVSAMLVEMQGKQFAAKESANPTTLEQAMDLISRLKREMPAAPAWLQQSTGVVSIGGRNSMFFLLADMMHKGACAGAEDSVGVNSEDCPEWCSATVETVYKALEAVVDRSEENLRLSWCWRPRSDPASLIVPKLCLIIASMESCGFRSFQWVRTVGNCPGIASMDPSELFALVAEH